MDGVRCFVGSSALPRMVEEGDGVDGALTSGFVQRGGSSVLTGRGVLPRRASQGLRRGRGIVEVWGAEAKVSLGERSIAGKGSYQSCPLRTDRSIPPRLLAAR